MADPTTPPADDVARARVFADLSHEIRGLMSGATLSADILPLARDEEERAKAVSSLKGAMRRLVRLADDLRDVADLLDPGRPSERVEHDVVVAARRMATELVPDAALHKVELVLESDGVPAHVLLGDPAAWDRALARLYLAGIECGRSAGRVVARLEARDGGLALVVPCGTIDLPPEGELTAAWAEARRHSEVFSRGLWLARAFLAAEGGRLTVDGDGTGRRLVATFPPPRTVR